MHITWTTHLLRNIPCHGSAPVYIWGQYSCRVSLVISLFLLLLLYQSLLDALFYVLHTSHSHSQAWVRILIVASITEPFLYMSHIKIQMWHMTWESQLHTITLNVFDVRALHTEQCDLSEGTAFSRCFSPFSHQIITHTHTHTLFYHRAQRPPDFLHFFFPREMCKFTQRKMRIRIRKRMNMNSKRLAYSKIFMLIKRAFTILYICITVCVCQSEKNVFLCARPKTSSDVCFLFFCSLCLFSHIHTDVCGVCVMMRCWFDYCFSAIPFYTVFVLREKKKSRKYANDTIIEKFYAK